MERGGLDFVGDYKGLAVYFDAKSTKAGTRFPLDNVKPHQADIVRDAWRRGAVAFLAVGFDVEDHKAASFYLVDWPILECWWDDYMRGSDLVTVDGKTKVVKTPRSIPRQWLEDHAPPIRLDGGVWLDLVGAIRLVKARMAA